MHFDIFFSISQTPVDGYMPTEAEMFRNFFEQVEAADARARQAELTYRSTILQAMREVSDALVGFHRNRELASSRGTLVEASRQALTLVEARYEGGSSSYLEVLDANSRRLDAELAQVRARLDVLLSYVDVYRALGGGWEV